MDHVRSHYIKPEPEDAPSEDVKPDIAEVEIREVGSAVAQNERSFPFPVDLVEETTVGGGTLNSPRVIYTCLNPRSLYYKCEECSFTASKRSVLNVHVKTHKKKCLVCAFTSGSEEMFAMHCRRHKRRKLSDKCLES